MPRAWSRRRPASPSATCTRGPFALAYRRVQQLFGRIPRSSWKCNEWLWGWVPRLVRGRFRRGGPAEDFAGAVVDLVDELVEFLLGEGVEAGAFGQVASYPAVEVLVGAALVGGVWIGEMK